MKVVISGSRSIRSLSKPVKSRLEKIISLDAEILIGDAPGVDALVMDYLVEKKYSKVTVWFTGSQPRNYRDSSWSVRRIKGSYEDRDRLMHSLADYALAIWDGQSRGTKRNIEQMKSRVRICLEV